MRGYNKGNPREWVPVTTKVFPVTGVLSLAEMPGKDPLEKGCYYALYRRGLAEVARASREAGECDLAPMDMGEDAP